MQTQPATTILARSIAAMFVAITPWQAAPVWANSFMTSNVTVVDNSTPLATVFAGRAGQPLGVTVRLTEAAAGSAGVGAMLSLTPSLGAKLMDVTSANMTGSSVMFGPFTVSSGVASAAVSKASTTATSADGNNITISRLDLSGVTVPGDVTVSVGGSPAFTPATVTIAKAINATSASTGAAVNGTSGATITLPDITITEAVAGAVVPNASSGIAAAARQISGFNTTSATVKAFSAAGIDVSTALGLSGLTALIGTAADQASFVTFSQTSASTANVGQVTYKISGLRAVLSSEASGAVTVQIAGADTTKALNEQTADTGAKLTPVTLHVANVAPPTTCGCEPFFPVPDQTKALLSGRKFAPAGNDQTKPGHIYVSVIFNGAVFFASPIVAPNTVVTLEPYAPDKSPAAYASSLQPLDITINTTPIDLTPLKGTQVIVGYGMGTSQEESFRNMLQQSTWNIIYTVK